MEKSRLSQTFQGEEVVTASFLKGRITEVLSGVAVLKFSVGAAGNPAVKREGYRNVIFLYLNEVGPMGQLGW